MHCLCLHPCFSLTSFRGQVLGEWMHFSSCTYIMHTPPPRFALTQHTHTPHPHSPPHPHPVCQVRVLGESFTPDDEEDSGEARVSNVWLYNARYRWGQCKDKLLGGVTQTTHAHSLEARTSRSCHSPTLLLVVGCHCDLLGPAPSCTTVHTRGTALVL
jgi:hypothetical protein